MPYILTDIFKGDFPVTQYFGANPAYYAQFGLAGHEGVDWGTPVGTWLINPFDKGQILRTGYDPAYGYYLVIWDPIQLCAVWYCHLSSINASPGQILSRGARVGKTGVSGNVTGAHLHCNLVETDKNANRLNTNNGYQGFINILDPNIVRWQLGGGSTPNADEKVRQAEESARKTEGLVSEALKSGDPKAKEKLKTTKDICKSTVQKIES